MADCSFLKRNDISTWTLVSGWHDIGGGVMGVNAGEVGVAEITFNLTVTSGAGGSGGGQDGFYLDIDPNTPITAEANLPGGFALLTVDGPVSGTIVATEFQTSGGGAPGTQVAIAALSVPSFPHTFAPPPANSLLFLPFTVTLTLTPTVGQQTTYVPAGAGTLVAAFLGTYSVPALTGWYESVLPGIRAGQDATIKLVEPAGPRGIFIEDPFTEDMPLHGHPRHAVDYDNKLYYAAGGYEVGVDNPTIRVWDGETDTEFCVVPARTVPQVGQTLPARCITTMLRLVLNNIPYIFFGTWDYGGDPSTLAGRIFRVNLNTGQLLVLGESNPIAAGHIPYVLQQANGYLWCGTHRGSATTAGAIFRTDAFQPTSGWTLMVDLTGTGQTAAVSMSRRPGGDGIFVGTFSTTQAAVVGYISASGQLGIALTGSSTTPFNGFYALQEFGNDIYAAYYDPAVAPSAIVNANTTVSAAPDSVLGPSPLNSNSTATGDPDFGACLTAASDGKTVRVLPTVLWNVADVPGGSKFCVYFDLSAVPADAMVSSAILRWRHRMTAAATFNTGIGLLVRYTKNGSFDNFSTANLEMDADDPEQAAFAANVSQQFTSTSYVVWATQILLSSLAELSAGSAGNGNVMFSIRANAPDPAVLWEVDRVWLELTYTTGSGSNAVIKKISVLGAGSWSTSLVMPTATTNDQIIGMFADGSSASGSLYAVTGKRTANVYFGRIFYTRGDDTWTEVTSNTPTTGLSSRAFTNAFGAITTS